MIGSVLLIKGLVSNKRLYMAWVFEVLLVCSLEALVAFLGYSSSLFSAFRAEYSCFVNHLTLVGG